MEENNYYPFGLKHENYNSEKYKLVKSEDGVSIVLEPTERNIYQYKFQGRELQDELGLNWYTFKWRSYDPTLGRFISIDPIAENYPHNSAYAFAENRVVESIDLEGKESWFTQDGSLATKAGPYTNAARKQLNLYSPSEVQQIRAKPRSNPKGPTFSQDRMTVAERKQNDISVRAQIAEREAAKQTTDNHENRGSPYNAKLVMEGVAIGIPQVMLEGIITDGFQAIKFFGKFSSSEISSFSKIGSTGKIGENALKALGGESQVYMKTSLGGRFVDQLVNDVANESKVGYTTLTKDISTQIAKDAELLSTGQVDETVWHFFQSPVTGQGGASKPLLDELAKNGIKAVIH